MQERGLGAVLLPGSLLEVCLRESEKKPQCSESPKAWSLVLNQPLRRPDDLRPVSSPLGLCFPICEMQELVLMMSRVPSAGPWDIFSFSKEVSSHGDWGALYSLGGGRVTRYMKKNRKGHLEGGTTAYKLGVGGREGDGLDTEDETTALAAPPGTKSSLLGEPSFLTLGLSLCVRPPEDRDLGPGLGVDCKRSSC